MKNTYKILCSLLIVTAFNSCQKEEGTIYDVLDYEKGAVLRTLNINSNLYNSSEPTSAFSVTVEEQDEQDGGLMESVDVYVSLRDLTPDNGTAVADDKFIKTIDASAFTTSPVGLPMATISATYAEAFAATGLGVDDVQPGDIFVVELRLNLTDGRVFGKASSSGIISGGFFSSPYAYNALITCSPEPGDYTVDMHDSFGDGWQTTAGNGGDGIHIDIDGTIVVIGMASPYGGDNIGTELDPNTNSGATVWPAGTDPATDHDFKDATVIVTIPVGTVSATWNFPGDQYDEIFFEVTGPNGEDLYSAGAGETDAGLLPITLCIID